MNPGSPRLIALIALACSIHLQSSPGQALPEIDAARETVRVERVWASPIPDAGLTNATIFGVVLEGGRLRFHGFSFNPMSGVDDCQLVGDPHLVRIGKPLEEGVPSYCKLRGTWRAERIEGGDAYIGYKREASAQMDTCLQEIEKRQGGGRGW
jgi:hypothetical protein